MSRTRLAMAAAVGSHQGPWIMANGHDSAIVTVYGLGPDTSLVLEIEQRNGLSNFVSLGVGRAKIREMQTCKRYRVVKSAPPGDTVPTGVELEYEGKAHATH